MAKKLCTVCRRRVWFWQCGVDSQFGFGHLSCIDLRLRAELQIVLADSFWRQAKNPNA
jgi:hypothetical protein